MTNFNHQIDPIKHKAGQKTKEIRDSLAKQGQIQVIELPAFEPYQNPNKVKV